MNKLLPTLVLGAFLAAHGPVFAQSTKPAQPAASAASAAKPDQKTEEKKGEPKKKEKKGGC